MTKFVPSKQNRTIILLLSFLIVVFSLQAPLDRSTNESKGYFTQCISMVLPSSLEIVSASAFEGTDLHSVFFGDGLVSVGENAFAGIAQLEAVYLPATVMHIENGAFPGSTIVYGVQGSFAQSWASESGHRFIAEDKWAVTPKEKTIHSELILSVLCTIALYDLRCKWHLKKPTLYYEKSMRPQDRPELYPVNYRFP